MSVAEISPRGEAFDRTPPHDVAAEQCVLGGMLLSKDAISDVIEVIHPQDHYRPAHQIIHEVILDLYARGEPADAITVGSELTKRGDLSRAGGAPYLHTLIASVPTAANAGYYARIVRERAILRRLVEVGTRIVQLGYVGDGDADELVDRAQAEVYGVTERRVSEDYLALSEIMPGTLDEIEAISSRGGGMVGVPTGFSDLDSLTNGLHPGQMIVIAARPAVGKALALDTPLPTPTGWTTMGDVKVGDHLIGADGRATCVVAATDVMCGRPCYEVEFSDGTIIVADAEHQWRTTTRAGRRQLGETRPGWYWSDDSRRKLRDAYAAALQEPDLVMTAQLAETVRCPLDGRPNHAVDVAKPVDMQHRNLPLPPYTLGSWLGDGASRSAQITTADPEIIAEIEAEGQARCPDCGGASSGRPQCKSCRAHHGTAQAILRSLGLLGNKHIPVEYLRASEPQRRALLAGLLDTDGYVNEKGTVQFAVTNARLAADALELVLSLGYKATMTTKPVNGASARRSTCYKVTFTPSDKVFRLSRKLARQVTQVRPSTRRRYIVDVRRVASVPVRCVQVDNADGLYLASRSWIPTHNSTLALDIARAASVRNGLTAVIFSLEMSRNEITMRLLSAESRVPLHIMRTGKMSDDDWTRLARRMSEVAEAPLFIDDSPNMSMMEIRAKCRRLKQRNDLRIVIVDYLQLMSSPRRVENRQQEVSDMSRALKLLAKELDVPVVAISQLNRGPEQRNDKRPLLSDLRESGSIEQDSDVVILLHREDAYERESPRAGEADLIVAKHRNGPTATVTVAFQGHYSRFVDMAPS